MIYIVGAGYMAREYSKVLQDIEEQFVVIGRSKEAVKKFATDINATVVYGGLTNYLKDSNNIPEFAIVCTPVETLASITKELLNFGVKNILIEKPGALSVEELLDLERLSSQSNSNVFIGYNRRYYQSTLALEKKLRGDEDLIAANFEITEWSHHIINEPCAEVVKQKWLIANTSHVIDLVMHITGDFKQLACFTTGKLNWHDSSSRFVGSGITENDVLVSYAGYWDGPGRWSAEFVTTKNRYIFRPMEKLQVQKIGSVKTEMDDTVNYTLDEKYKPGLFLQTKSFLDGDYSKLCSLAEQISAFRIYERIANYN